MISFLLIMIILIVNLLIAMLTATYREHTKKKNAIMLLQTLSVRNEMESDDRYSSLISWMPPLFLLNWVFSPFLFLSKSPSKLNRFILHLEYLPVFIMSFAIFICINVILLPICYFKMTLHRFILVC